MGEFLHGKGHLRLENDVQSWDLTCVSINMTVVAGIMQDKFSNIWYTIILKSYIINYNHMVEARLHMLC
jgi:hypothetical protein